MLTKLKEKIKIQDTENKRETTKKNICKLMKVEKLRITEEKYRKQKTNKY